MRICGIVESRNALKKRKIFRMSGREGVRLYKALHRTVQRVFRGDRAAMFAARDKVLYGFLIIIHNIIRCVRSLIRAGE